MSPSPQKQKKSTSVSFTDSHLLRNTQKQHFRQIRSQDRKLPHEEEKSIEQKVRLNNLLSKKIEQHNQLNATKHKPFQWQLVLIDQKRTISGFKAKIKCKLVPSELYLIVRLSFTQDFFKLGDKVQEGTVFVELEELNFQITKGEKRNFQVQLQKTIKPLFSRTIFAEGQEEHKWVKDLLAAVQAIIESNEYQKRSKKLSESLNRKEILTKYILYHPPVCLTWSPKGLFCLTENKVPANKTSLIGNPLSFKQNIEVPKVSLKTVVEQELIEPSQQTPQISIFNWDMSEELQLFALSNHKRQISAYYKDNTKRDLQSKKKLVSSSSLVSNNNNANSMNGGNVNGNTGGMSGSPKDQTSNYGGSIKNDYMILEYGWKKLPLNIRKIYERYFTNRNDFQFDITRGQKLNVYFVLSQNKTREDQMLYLMEKINTDKLKPSLQVILGTMLSSYPTLLSSQNPKTLDSMKYFIISQLFKQQRQKSAGCPFNLSMCLKSIMVENQYHSLELQTYFNSCFKQLGINNAPSKYNIYYLGSYMHFDEYKAERILMKLLQQYEYNYELNLKNEKEVRFILQSKTLERIKKHIKIKKIVKFPPIKDDWLLTDDNRKHFVQIILPILLIRDRNYEEFYYKQLQRIVTTNQKIIKFFKNLSNMIKKVEQERHDFIKHIINEYSIYQHEKRIKDQVKDVRRLFTVYCQKCQKPKKTFQIAQTQKLRICNRCSQTTNKKN